MTVREKIEKKMIAAGAPIESPASIRTLGTELIRLYKYSARTMLEERPGLKTAGIGTIANLVRGQIESSLNVVWESIYAEVLSKMPNFDESAIISMYL